MSPDQIKDLANSIISAAAPQPPVEGLSADALNALKSYQQADADGVMVLVSRQALEEAIKLLASPSLTAGPVAYRWQEKGWGDYWIYNPEPDWLAEQNNIVKQALYAAPATLTEQSGQKRLNSEGDHQTEQSGKQLSPATDPELLALIERAKSHVMSPAERYEQRRSFVRGMCPSKRDYTEWCAEVDRLLPPGGGA